MRRKHQKTRKSLFSSPRKSKKKKEISALKLFKMMTVLSWSCFALKNRRQNKVFYANCGKRWEKFLWLLLNAFYLQLPQIYWLNSLHQLTALDQLDKVSRAFLHNSRALWVRLDWELYVARMIIVYDKVLQFTQCFSNQCYKIQLLKYLNQFNMRFRSQRFT